MDSKFQNYAGKRAKMENEEMTRLHRIRKTVMQMPRRDRGYMVADVEVEMTRAQFFQSMAKVGVLTMKTYTNRMKEDNVNRAIPVYSFCPNPCISEISTHSLGSFPEEAELLIYIRPCSCPRREKTLLERYTVKLPRIQITDRITRYYEMKYEQVEKEDFIVQKRLE